MIERILTASGERLLLADDVVVARCYQSSERICFRTDEVVELGREDLLWLCERAQLTIGG